MATSNTPLAMRREIDDIISNEVFDISGQLVNRYDDALNELATKVRDIWDGEHCDAYELVRFSGGGFGTTIYVPRLLYMIRSGSIGEHTMFHGASLGSCWAVVAAVLSGNTETVSYAERWRVAKRVMGVLMRYIEAPHCDWMGSRGKCAYFLEHALREIPPTFLPDIAARVHMSATIVRPAFPPLVNKMYTGFVDMDDLVAAYTASMYIVGWTEPSGIFYWLGSNPCIDGGATDNCVDRDPNFTGTQYVMKNERSLAMLGRAFYPEPTAHSMRDSNTAMEGIWLDFNLGLSYIIGGKH